MTPPSGKVKQSHSESILKMAYRTHELDHHMRRNTTGLVIAIGCGLTVLLIVNNQLQEAKKLKTRVVIATRAVAPGTVLEEEMLTLNEPESEIQTDYYFLQVRDLLGKSVNQTIPKGARIHRRFINREMKTKKEAVKSLPIPPRMRALTLSRNELREIPKYLSIGQFVDVLGFRSRKHDEQSIVVHSAQILDLNKAEQAKEEIISVTLAVTPAEAERIISTTRDRKVRLLARSGPGEKPRQEAPQIEPKRVMKVIRGSQKPEEVDIPSLE
jgi:Flp pilus assembly protein CpaB